MMTDAMMNDEIDDYYSNTLGGTSSQGYAALGGSVAGLVTGALSIKATKEDVKNRNEAISINMESEGEALAFKQQQTSDNLKILSRAVGHQMTKIGYEQMVLEGKMKAQGAESGSTTMTDELVQETMTQASFAKADISLAYENTAISTLRQSQADLMSYENRLESLMSQMQSPESVGLQTASAGMSGIGYGISISNSFSIINRNV